MSLNATSYPISIDEMHVPTAAALAKRRAVRREIARKAEIRHRLGLAGKVVSYTDMSPDEDFTMDMLFQFDYAADSESPVSRSKGGKSRNKNKKNRNKNKKKKKAAEVAHVEDEEWDGFVIVNSSDYAGTEGAGNTPAGRNTVTRACVPVSTTSKSISPPYPVFVRSAPHETPGMLRLTNKFPQDNQFSAVKHIRLPSDRANRSPWDALRVVRGVLGFGWD